MTTPNSPPSNTSNIGDFSSIINPSNINPVSTFTFLPLNLTNSSTTQSSTTQPSSSTSSNSSSSSNTTKIYKGSKNLSKYPRNPILPNNSESEDEEESNTLINNEQINQDLDNISSSLNRTIMSMNFTIPDNCEVKLIKSSDNLNTYTLEITSNVPLISSSNPPHFHDLNIFNTPSRNQAANYLKECVKEYLSKETRKERKKYFSEVVFPNYICFGSNRNMNNEIITTKNGFTPLEFSKAVGYKGASSMYRHSRELYCTRYSSTPNKKKNITDLMKEDDVDDA